MATQDFFVWGKGGSKLTPEQLEQRRQVEEALLAKGIDTSPVGHWAQGLARVANAAAGSFRRGQLERDEEENATYNSDIINSLLGGGSSASSSVPMTSAAGEVAATSPAPAAMTGVSPDVSSLEGYIRESAAKRGIDPDVAVRVARSEGLAPGVWQSNVINKAGKRETSYGPFQLLVGGGLGDKFQEVYGKSPADPSTVRQQIDFALDEAAQGGWSPWYGAAKVGVGARTGLENARALGYQPAAIAPNEVAAATPQAAIEAVAPASGYVDPRVSAPNAEPAFDAGRFADPISLTEMPPSQADLPMALSQQRQSAGQAAIERQAPPLPAPVEVAPVPAVAEAPQQQIAQALTAPAPASPGINPAILQALSDPRATPQTQRIAAMLLQQEQQKQQMAEEQRLQAADPLRQIQLQREQLELDQMRQPKQQPLINAGNGAVYDPNTKAWIQAPGGGQEFRQATPEEAQKYGSAAGQFGPDGKFYPINPPQGTALSVGPNGEITFNQGAGVKPLTEAQSKDTLYATRATNALPLVDKYESELLSLSGNLAEGIPLNLGNYAQSEQYQVARDAGRDFLATILRKDTGAAITSNEEAIYGKMFLPQPGDKPAAIQAKRQRRALAVEAIKAGMPTAAIENMAKALETVPPSKVGDAISDPSRAEKPISEMTDEELEALANGN